MLVAIGHSPQDVVEHLEGLRRVCYMSGSSVTRSGRKRESFGQACVSDESLDISKTHME